MIHDDQASKAGDRGTELLSDLSTAIATGKEASCKPGLQLMKVDEASWRMKMVAEKGRLARLTGKIKRDKMRD